MKSGELKKIQMPLKAHYRENPEAAVVTLRAEGKIGEGLSCKVETGHALVEAGLHPATGGNGLLVCSGDLLLEALVACAGVTLNAVANSLGIEIRNATIRAEGEIDFRGTLGVSKDVPVGFRAIRLRFYIESDDTAERIETLLKLTERYCVVFQTLKKGTPISLSYNFPAKQDQ